jgi:hypothetical protein
VKIHTCDTIQQAIPDRYEEGSGTVGIIPVSQTIRSAYR